jgi:hypothetical protein
MSPACGLYVNNEEATYTFVHYQWLIPMVFRLLLSAFFCFCLPFSANEVESPNLSPDHGADFLSRKMGANELTATTESFRFCARSSPQFPRKTWTLAAFPVLEQRARKAQ